MNYNAPLPLWYRLKTYFTAYASDKYGSFWFRTPLFAVGYYRAAQRQDSTSLQTGFSLDWLPLNWKLSWRRGGQLYRKHWDNLITVYQLEDNEESLMAYPDPDAKLRVDALGK